MKLLIVVLFTNTAHLGMRTVQFWHISFDESNPTPQEASKSTQKQSKKRYVNLDMQFYTMLSILTTPCSKVFLVVSATWLTKHTNRKHTFVTPQCSKTTYVMSGSDIVVSILLLAIACNITKCASWWCVCGLCYLLHSVYSAVSSIISLLM